MIQNSDDTGNYVTTSREGISQKLTPQNLANRRRQFKTGIWGDLMHREWLTMHEVWIFTIGPNPDPPPLWLLPTTRHPHPATASGHPSALDPHSRRPWTHDITSRHPDIRGSGPSPITPGPDIPGSGRHRLRFNSNGWWSPGHYHLSSRNSCGYFLCSCRSCHRRRLSSAAHQCKWCQRQQTNAFSHIRLLFLNSFGAGYSALLK